MSQDKTDSISEARTGKDTAAPVSLIISEIELLLAEKRTALSVMRTGIAVFALPLSVFSILIVTSRYYTLSKVVHWLIPVSLLNVALVVLGAYLVIRALKRIRLLDTRVNDLKTRFREIAELVE